MYKRQALSFSRYPDIIKVPILGEGPVSYTHLDVYKRQAVDKALCNLDVITPDLHGRGNTESYKNAIIAQLA